MLFRMRQLLFFALLLYIAVFALLKYLDLSNPIQRRGDKNNPKMNNSTGKGDIIPLELASREPVHMSRTSSRLFRNPPRTWPVETV